MGCLHEQEKISKKGGYSVEVLGSYGNKVVWEVIEDHVFEDPKENDDIGIRGFDFNFFVEYKGGGGI